MADSSFHDLFDLGADTTPYRQLSSDHVATATFAGAPMVTVAPEALTLLAAEAYRDCQHLLRPGHFSNCATSSTMPKPRTMTGSSRSIS